MNQDAFTGVKTPAQRRGALFGGSVWLFSDHVLSIRNMRFLEEYARYYYKDIQAIEVRRAPRFCFPLWMVCVFLLLGVLGLIFLFRAPHIVATVSFGVLLVLAGFNAYRSFFQSCVCHIVTAVSTDAIPAMFRIKATHRTVEMIRDRVTAVQGALEFDAEQLQAAISDRSIQPELSSVTARLTSANREANGAQKRGLIAATVAIFGTFADALITLSQSHHIRTSVPGWLGHANLLVVLISAVFSVILFAQSTELRWLRNLALTSALFVVSVSYFASEIGGFWRALNRPTDTRPFTQFSNTVTNINIGGDFCMVAVAIALAIRYWLQTASRQASISSGGLQSKPLP